MRAFVAEHYLAAGAADTAAREASTTRSAAEQLSREGVRVRFMQSIFIPQDETCLHLYLADSIEAIHAVAGCAALSFEHVAEAICSTGAPGAGEPAQ